ncbi:hypothetical protein [uncultured Sunxiuqinia sp.]|uniref:hypothetical protein n=1 Tax=Sunxiuqinia rutila TaxID=1397841 RepID=UPI00261FCE96|nr:hypothetical protein [uncultured Sunxiuqinia sp.]
MNLANSAIKKIDIFWLVFSIVFISSSIYFWQKGQDYFLFVMLASMGIVNSIKVLIPKILFNILRASITVAVLLYILRIIIE